MGHAITAVIGRREVVERLLVPTEGDPAPTALAFDLVIAPLGHAQIDRLTHLRPGPYAEGFRFLSSGLETALMQWAGEAVLAYIETAYFGSQGTQSAAVFRDGAVILRSGGVESGPINAALDLLGVVASDGRDRFDTLGLGRFRRPEDLGLVADD